MTPLTEHSAGEIITEAAMRFLPIAIGAAIFGFAFWFWLRWKVRAALAAKAAHRDGAIAKARERRARATRRP